MSRVEIQEARIEYTVQRRKPKKGPRALRGSAKRRTITVLEDVNLTLRAGDRVALIGPNGAGKTSLLRAISGMLPPTAGRITVEGRLLSLINNTEGLIGYVDLFENARLFGLLNGIPAESVAPYAREVLALSRLDDKAGMPMNSLSTGMRGRFNIALLDPLRAQIVVMDEWIGTTDNKVIKRSKGLLADMLADVDIFILATHRQSIAATHCNRAVLLNEGRIEQFEGVDEAFVRYEQIV